MNNLRIPTMQAVNTATNLKQHLERSIPGSETSQPITFMVPSESERARERERERERDRTIEGSDDHA